MTKILKQASIKFAFSQGGPSEAKRVTGVYLRTDGTLAIPNRRRKHAIEQIRIGKQNGVLIELTKPSVGQIHSARQIEPSFLNSIF